MSVPKGKEFEMKHGYSTGLSQVCAPHIADPVVWTDGHVTITSLPKFLGLIGCQICLAMVLRY